MYDFIPTHIQKRFWENMFKNISFMFLSALAITAWSVLCYLHAIQQQKNLSDYHVELYTEYPGISHVPPPICPQESGLKIRGFELICNFGLIFAGLLALSKLLQWLERQAFIHFTDQPTQPAGTKFCQEALEHRSESNDKNGGGFNLENAELKEQLSTLQAHCQEMRELLQELRTSSSTSSIPVCKSSQSDTSDIITWKAPVSAPLENCSSQDSMHTPTGPSTQNVYITNSHIHINGCIYLSQRNVNIDLCRQASMYTRKQSEFLQVWDNFIGGPKERPMIAGIRCNNILM